jgi:hypothetical protein
MVFMKLSQTVLTMGKTTTVAKTRNAGATKANPTSHFGQDLEVRSPPG